MKGTPRVWAFRLLALLLACKSTSTQQSGPNDGLSARGRLQNANVNARTPDAEAATDLAASDGGPANANANALLSNAEKLENEASDDPSDLHVETKEGLLALITLRPFTDAERKRIGPELFLEKVLGPSDPQHISQGNKAISKHTISRRTCLQGLRDIVIQTPEQRTACGYDNMVPVHLPGKEPYFCMDVFEFPNKACELPFVWAPPTYAEKLCQLEGKRLCSQSEWQVSCGGDPDSGPSRKYAYGDRLDLSACNTQKFHPQPCNTTGVDKAFATCATQTEPSGAFPQCRSRFGAFDLHGNVAEIMKRRDVDGTVVSQLKGSAFFYTAIAREPGEPPKMSQKGMETYPDHCNFDPRWHVEPIENAWHVNYHLGFRCCKNIP
jgi:formylglycine-generating enzyme